MTSGWPPIARKSDPGTSHQAAHQLTDRDSLIARVADYVVRNPGKVRGEIADGLEETQERVWRRVSDCVRKGYVIYGYPRLYQSRMQQTCWPSFDSWISR